MCGDDHGEHPDDETASVPLPIHPSRNRNDATTSGKLPRRDGSEIRAGLEVIRLALGEVPMVLVRS
jgi:hypothetical protein